MGEEISQIMAIMIVVVTLAAIIIVAMVLQRRLGDTNQELVKQVELLEKQEQEVEQVVQETERTEPETVVVERVIEKVVEVPIVQQVVTEVEKPVVKDVTGFGFVTLGIALIVFLIVAYKLMLRFIHLRQNKIKVYKEVLEKPLETYEDVKVNNLINKYN